MKGVKVILWVRPIGKMINSFTYCEGILCFGYYALYDENTNDGPVNFSPSYGLGF